AQAGYSALLVGVAVVAPALRARYGLSLAEVGVLLAAPSLGSIGTLYPWGIAADRIGERYVIAAGLGGAGACLAAAAYAGWSGAIVGLLTVAGALGASVNSASGRAVLHWFEPRQRGLALGIRQTALPIGGAWAAFVLPALVTHEDARPALLTIGG